MSLDSNVILVTGASRGIGRAIALQLGQKIRGTVIGTATSDAGAEKISQFLQEANIEGFGVTLDIASENSIQHCMETLKNKVGLPSILVNNAAITADNLFMRMSQQEWSSVINTNLTGVFSIIHACIRSMVKARFGRIINISSVVGCTGNPGQVNYAAAKAGIIGMTKSIARELGSRNITANVVAPGFIDTDMTKQLSEEQRDKLISQIPLGRMGNVDDVASAVAFLASPEASYITGETIHVNGGMYMC